MTPAMSRFFVSVAGACLIAAQPAAASAQVSGEALYAQRCAMCHDKAVPRAPARRGGTLNGSGPVVAGGMVLVGSGYGRFGQVPGNVLICLSVDGR
jgi:cytochrome c5